MENMRFHMGSVETIISRLCRQIYNEAHPTRRRPALVPCRQVCVHAWSAETAPRCVTPYLSTQMPTAQTKKGKRPPASIESRIAECYDELSEIDQRLAD